MSTILDIFVAGIALVAIFGGIYAAYYIFRAIAEWRIFTKAGEKGWKSLIPFLNVYTEYKLTANKKEFGLYLLFTFLAALAQQYEGENVIILILVLIANVLALVYTIKRWNYLAKAFGKGTGYTLGLLFLNPLFILILGLGGAKYIGPDNK